MRLLTTADDTGGRPYLYTSYADTAGTTIVNQVQQAYNGLGQLTREWQSHAGAVTQGTLSVQYYYSFVLNSGGSAPNHSRLTDILYPDGTEVQYGYNSGVDNDISRVSYIAMPNYVESYTYLGLDTIVSPDAYLVERRPGAELCHLWRRHRWGRSVHRPGSLRPRGRTAMAQHRLRTERRTTLPTPMTGAGSVFTREQYFPTEQYTYDGLNRCILLHAGRHRDPELEPGCAGQLDELYHQWQHPDALLQ